MEHTAQLNPVFRLDPAAHRHSFAYAPAVLALIGPALLDGQVDEEASLEQWLDGFRTGAPDDTLTLLKALNEAIGATDPTQRRIGAAGLVATAMGATSDAVLPVTGGFQGAAANFRGMDVTVSVTSPDAGHSCASATGAGAGPQAGQAANSAG